MLNFDKLVKITSDKTQIDEQIVKDVCKFVFEYTADTMKDRDNTLDILFNKAFKFKLKTRFKK